MFLAGIQHLLDHQPHGGQELGTARELQREVHRVCALRPEELCADLEREGGVVMKRVFAAAAIAAALCTLAGCYIGKAEFKGEDMKMYPFFGTSAVPTE